MGCALKTTLCCLLSLSQFALVESPLSWASVLLGSVVHWASRAPSVKQGSAGTPVSWTVGHAALLSLGYSYMHVPGCTRVRRIWVADLPSTALLGAAMRENAPMQYRPKQLWSVGVESLFCAVLNLDCSRTACSLVPIG